MSGWLWGEMCIKRFTRHQEYFYVTERCSNKNHGLNVCYSVNITELKQANADCTYIHMRKIFSPYWFHPHCPALAKHNALLQSENWGVVAKGNHLKTQEPEASSKGQQVKVTGESLTLLPMFIPGWRLTVAFRWPLHPILNENDLRWKHICIACQKPTMGWHVAQAKLSGSMIHCVGILCSELTEKYATTEGHFVDFIHYTNTTNFFFFTGSRTHQNVRKALLSQMSGNQVWRKQTAA